MVLIFQDKTSLMKNTKMEKMVLKKIGKKQNTA